MEIDTGALPHSEPNDGGTRSAVSAPSRPAPAARRELLAATVGAVVESYDWTVYGSLAAYYSGEVFPGTDRTVQLLLAFATFAVGFVARPFGSLLIGRITDTRGRRFGLTLSMSVIATGSLIVALVPTYRQIGVAAAVIVVVVRLIQGLSMGGENPSAAAYVTETAPRGRRFLYSALSYGGVVLGGLLSFTLIAVLLALVGTTGLSHGGWRIAFGIGALLGLSALWIRRQAAESEVFVAEIAARPERIPVWPVLRTHFRSMLAVFLISIGGTTSFYFGTLYLPRYVSVDLKVVGSTSATVAINLALLALLAGMAVAGAVTDRIGSLPATRLGYGALALLTVPLISLISQRILPFGVGAVLYLLLLALPLAIANVFGGQLFPPEIRTVGMGVPSALAIGLFGGTFPLLATALGAHGLAWLVPWLAAGAALISFAASFLLRHNPDTAFRR